MTILEDLKSGRLVVVPREALADLCNAVMADISEAKRRLDADIPKDAPVHPVSAFLTGTALHVGKARASPDHTAGLIALVEGMAAERDEAAKAFASGAYDDACKREAGIHQHALAFTVEQFRKAEARALAAEAERDALREALAWYADEDNYKDRLVTRTCGCCSDHEPAAIGPDGDEGQVARAALARALTEKNNDDG